MLIPALTAQIRAGWGPEFSVENEGSSCSPIIWQAPQTQPSGPIVSAGVWLISQNPEEVGSVSGGILQVPVEKTEGQRG